MTDFEAERTWFDNALDPVVGWGTGHANVFTFGTTNWLQGSIYGKDLLAYNQSGWSYTVGTGTGIVSSVLMGYGAAAGAASGTFSMVNTMRTGPQAWAITGDIVGVAQSSYNVLNAQEPWSEGPGFLPMLGAGAAASRNLRGIHGFGLTGTMPATLNYGTESQLRANVPSLAWVCISSILQLELKRVVPVGFHCRGQR